MNTNTKIANICWDENLRVDQILWIAGNAPNISDALKDLGEEEEEITRLLGKDFQEAFNTDPEEFLCECSRKGKTGFLVQVAVPVPHFYSEGDGLRYSWGHCYTHWFYAEALNKEFIEQVAAWKAERYASVRNKSGNSEEVA